ncbi:MAG: biopolymer transporter ExbD [Gemmatimonadetes bacterium]|nr:biopolymer transporter ExbD [Gemmatimonadota bacterium]MCZ6824076.1 biopolymer transporter ExbD [Gemmatimonadota bacterium]
MNRSRQATNGLPVRAEINVTSLVDVAFILLIIFMITAPILQGGVEIEIPRAPAAPLRASEGIVITIDRTGRIYLDDTPVTMAEFDASVVQVIKRRDPETVYVKGDANVAYGVVLKVIGKLKEAEIESVSLVAEPEEEGRGG